MSRKQLQHFLYFRSLLISDTFDVFYAVHFRNVLCCGLEDYSTLPRYEMISVLSCIEVADIDLDGHDEILVGSSNLV